MSAGTSMSGGGGAAGVAGATSGGSLGFIYGGRLPPRPPTKYLLNQLGLVDPDDLPSDPMPMDVAVTNADPPAVPDDANVAGTNRQLLCICIASSVIVLGIVVGVAVIVSQV